MFICKYPKQIPSQTLCPRTVGWKPHTYGNLPNINPAKLSGANLPGERRVFQCLSGSISEPAFSLSLGVQLAFPVHDKNGQRWSPFSNIPFPFACRVSSPSLQKASLGSEGPLHPFMNFRIKIMKIYKESSQTTYNSLCITTNTHGRIPHAVKNTPLICTVLNLTLNLC